MAFRTPIIYGCNWIGLLAVCLLGTTIVARDLPKYKHSEYPTQLCYKCPPGYKFEGECEVSVDGSSPQWSKCAPCDNGQYQDSWNVNPRCKPRNQCISGHVDLVDDSENKLTGPVCACQSRYIEDDRGDCVQGFTKSENDEFVRIAITQAREEDVAKCDKRIATIQSMTSSTATATKNGTLCTTTRPDQCRENSILRWALVLVSIFAVASFAFNIHQYCKSKRITARGREDKERDNDSFKSGVETSNNNMEMRQRSYRKESTPYGNGDYQNGARNSRVSFNADLLEARPLLPGEGCVSVDTVPIFTDAVPSSSLDEALRILENRIRPHPEELDRLMRNIFDFSANECEEIKAMSKDTASKVRYAFKKWQRKHGDDAVALVRSLERHKWNDEADEIAEALGVLRMAVDAESLDELDEATKICEQKIGKKNDAVRFVRSLGVEFDYLNMSGVEIVREGVRIWRRKRASKATVQELVEILYEAEFVDVADEISDNLQGQSDKVYTVHETSRVQEDKAAPTYNLQEQPDDQPVREMAQPTVDAEAQSTTSGPVSHSEAASSYVDDRSVSQTTIPKTFFPVPPAMPTADDVNEDDSFAIKLDDEDNSRTIMDVDFIDERNAGDGKEPPDQSSKKQS